MLDTTIESILDYWFSDVREHPELFRTRQKFWFSSSPRTDTGIRAQFGELVERAGSGALDEWATQPAGALALVLLLDQFPRSIYRGTARAFDYDARALQITRNGIARGLDRRLSVIERGFFYMPFQHSEDRETQAESERLFAQLRDDAKKDESDAAYNFHRFSLEHKNIVDTFGRFPHRNEILGRPNSEAEREYLEQSGKNYGQSVA